MKWYEQNPEKLENIKLQIRKNYPTLNVVIEHKTVFVRGSLFLFDSVSSREIDRYGIEIRFPDDYPVSIPRVTETEDRIPKILDRHFMSDGFACLFFRDEQYKFYNKKTTIVDFIGIPVYNFFLSQSYFELTGKWVFGARSHGKAATWEYYSEELGTTDIDTIGRFLCFLSSNKLNIRHNCYCGSKKPLAICHLSKVLKMRRDIPVLNARLSLKEMTEMKNNITKAIKWVTK